MKNNQKELNIEPRLGKRNLVQLCLLPMVMVLVLAGCKRDAKVPADSNAFGTYTLVSVDGNNVPCTVQHEGHSLAVKSGSFDINSDGTCSSKVVFSTPQGGDASRGVKARYTREGAKLTMQWEGAGTTSGTVEGSTFTMNNEGMVFAYRK
jgi:hypothetical protein